MKTIQVTTYSAAELKARFPEAFEHALEHYRTRLDAVPWQEEIFDSLKATCEAAGVKLRDWNLGLCNRSNGIKIEFSNDDAGELTGKRAFAWLENNLFGPLRISYTARNRWELSKYNRSYTDKSLMPYTAGKVKPCPLTGVCFDEDYLESLTKAIRSGDTLKEAFEQLADVYVTLLEAEYEAQMTEEYFIESHDDDCFTEDGERF